MTTLLALPACSSEPTLADRVQACLDETIAHRHTAYWVQGTWRIHGTGKRTGCAQPSLDTDTLELGSASFRVQQSRYSLAVDKDSSHQNDGTVFGLDGTVGQRCVRFMSSEARGGEVISYDFVAEFVNARTISGEFTGTGPLLGCRTEGNFVLSIDLDPLPPPLSGDAGTIAPANDGGSGGDMGDAAGDAPSPDASAGPDAAPSQPDSGLGGGDGAAATTDAASDTNTIAIDDGAAAPVADADTDADADTNADATSAEDAGLDVTAQEDAITDDAAGVAEDGSFDVNSGETDGASTLPAEGGPAQNHEGGLAAQDAQASSADGATTDEADFTYVLWDLSVDTAVHAAGEAKSSCAVHTPRQGTSPFAAALAVAAAFAARWMSRRNKKSE